jgi:hypothetical protein
METSTEEKAKTGVAKKIATKVISRETLKEKVREAVAHPDVKAGTVFIAGVTKARDYNGTHQMMLEVVQKKQLNQAQKINLLSALNAGDDRFRANSRTLRVWLKITPAGFNNIFASMGITGEDIQEKTKDLKKDQVLMTFARVRTINVEGEEEIPTISVKQYSAEGGLPNRIQKILDIEEEDRTEDQDADLKGLSMRTNDDEPLVDEFGNQVYELNELTYGEEENVLIRKMPLSEYKKIKKTVKKSVETKDEIKDEIAGLVD